MRRRKREFRLFITYMFSKDGNTGFGNIIGFYNHKQCISPSEIRQAEKEIKEDGGFDSVAILNYKFM